MQRIAAETDRDIRSLIGDASFLKRLDPKKYTDETFGLPTVTDILQELEKNPVATHVPSSRPPSSRKASKTSRTCNWG
ncbi:hypothetical protein ACFS4T_02000 [Pseudomonas lini]